MISSRLIIAALAVLCLTSALSAQEIACDFCGKSIEGEYYRFDNGIYHTECYRQHIAPRCDWCGGIIEGEYYTNDSGVYHINCFRDHIAVKCDLCGQIVNGKYIVDPWGNKICAHHQKDILQCDYCQRFISDNISGGAIQYPDKRIVCKICYEDIIVDNREARKLMQDVANTLNGYGIAIDINKVPIDLVNRNEMRDKAKDKHMDLSGFAYYEQTSIMGGLFKTHNFKVYLLDGMPRFYFIATMAHELMHVWLYENGPFDMEPILTEGSCNYAAWLVIQHYRGDDFEVLKDLHANNTDPIYGEGFRKVRQFIDDNSIDIWLSYIRENEKPPW